MICQFCIAALLISTTNCLPIAPQYSQYPAHQEVARSPQVTMTANHGFVYGPQQPLQADQVQTTPEVPSKISSYSLNDPDIQLIARSLQTAATGSGFSKQFLTEIPPCSSDGRSVTIDHLRISPDSLAQIAKLAQAFGANPNWQKLRLSDMKSALETPMHPTHKFAARSIGL